MSLKACEKRCALIEYLRVIGADDIRTSDSPHRAKLAAMMLSEFGYFGDRYHQPDIDHLRELVQILGELGDSVFSSELADKCKQCPESVVCAAGETLLRL